MLAHLRGLLSPEEAKGIRHQLTALPFEDGRVTALGAARKHKNNLQVDVHHPVSQEVSNLLMKKLASSEPFSALAWPRKIQPFRFCRYDEGMEYGDHVDLPSMGERAGNPMRTDLSITVFLSPLDEYEGGHLAIFDDSGTQRIRGAPGDAILYPSNRVHRVEPVTRGSRVVAISWIESRMRNERDRQFLFEMGRSLRGLESNLAQTPQAQPDLLRLRNCMYELTRRWLD